MTKILATFVQGQLTKMKELPTDKALLEQEGLANYRANKLLQEIDVVEKRTLMMIRDNFEDLRDFVHQNI